MLCSTRTIHILIYLSWYLLSCLRQFLQCVTVSILSVFLRQKSIVLWSHLTTWCLGVNAIIDLCTFFSHRLYFILLAKLTSINKQLIFVKISSVLIDQTYNPLMLYVVCAQKPGCMFSFFSSWSTQEKTTLKINLIWLFYWTVLPKLSFWQDWPMYYYKQ